jgi:hypothetical protein
LIYNIIQNLTAKSINRMIKTNIDAGLNHSSPFSPKLVREQERSDEVIYDGAAPKGEREGTPATERLSGGGGDDHNGDDVQMMEGTCRVVTARQDAGVENAAHGKGRRHQSIEDEAPGGVTQVTKCSTSL